MIYGILVCIVVSVMCVTSWEIGEDEDSTFSTSNLNIEDDDYLWDNETTDTLYEPNPQRTKSIFNLKLTFIGGFTLGFLFSCVYAGIHYYYVLVAATSSRRTGREPQVQFRNGTVNLAFIGDDADVPANDNPPEYHTVVAEASSDQPDKRTFLNWFWKKDSKPKEPPPPSYDSVTDPKPEYF